MRKTDSTGFDCSASLVVRETPSSLFNSRISVIRKEPKRNATIEEEEFPRSTATHPSNGGKGLQGRSDIPMLPCSPAGMEGENASTSICATKGPLASIRVSDNFLRSG